MKCRYCGKPFIEASVNQIYCSTACGNKYRRRFSVQENYPSITFQCAACGRRVVTEGGSRDKRTRFYCSQCEKKYWRHRYLIESKGMSERTNFRNIKEYIAYEKKSNNN